jgi:peroxiredoxin
MPKLTANNTVVLGISKDSPAANNAFAQQLGVTFPLLSDMNGTVMEQYGILQKNKVQGQDFEWARRTTFVVDEQGIIRHIQQGTTAINPNNAVAICLDLHGKEGKKK